jgi:hypothetical protein
MGNRNFLQKVSENQRRFDISIKENEIWGYEGGRAVFRLNKRDDYYEAEDYLAGWISPPLDIVGAWNLAREVGVTEEEFREAFGVDVKSMVEVSLRDFVRWFFTAGQVPVKIWDGLSGLLEDIYSAFFDSLCKEILERMEEGKYGERAESLSREEKWDIAERIVSSFFDSEFPIFEIFERRLSDEEIFENILEPVFREFIERKGDVVVVVNIDEFLKEAEASEELLRDALYNFVGGIFPTGRFWNFVGKRVREEMKPKRESKFLKNRGWEGRISVSREKKKGAITFTAPYFRLSIKEFVRWFFIRGQLPVVIYDGTTGVLLEVYEWFYDSLVKKVREGLQEGIYGEEAKGLPDEVVDDIVRSFLDSEFPIFKIFDDIPDEEIFEEILNRLFWMYIERRNDELLVDLGDFFEGVERSSAALFDLVRDYLNKKFPYRRFYRFVKEKIQEKLKLESRFLKGLETEDEGKECEEIENYILKKNQMAYELKALSYSLERLSSGVYRVRIDKQVIGEFDSEEDAKLFAQTYKNLLKGKPISVHTMSDVNIKEYDGRWRVELRQSLEKEFASERQALDFIQNFINIIKEAKLNIYLKGNKKCGHVSL